MQSVRSMKMKLRLRRIAMFKGQSLRHYEAFVWRICKRREQVKEELGLPSFLRRQAN